MTYMKASRITFTRNGVCEVEYTDADLSVFSTSQFFPALDGTWLMVDYMTDEGNWYVTEGV